MADEQKYSHRLMRDSIFTKLILLRCDLNTLARETSIPLVVQLAIKSLANDANALEDVLGEYIIARTEEDEDTE